MDAEKIVKPLELIRLMNRARVKYVLVGRRALIFYGAPVQTVDYDFFISNERKDITRLKRICGDHDIEMVPFGTDNVLKSYKLSLYSGAQKFDVFRARIYSTKTGDKIVFKELWETRQDVTLSDGTTVHLPILACLKKTKEIRLSEKDKLDLRYIDALMEREK